MAIIGSANINIANEAGTPTNTITRKAQSIMALNSSLDFCACLADKDGKITVATAIPIKPKGNSVKRSAVYNHDTEPEIKKDAKIVSNNKFI